VKAHIKEQKDTFTRFNVHWTPTQLVLDSDGVERHRIEGFLPSIDFMAQLELGLGKFYFQKEDYARAEEVLRSDLQTSIDFMAQLELGLGKFYFQKEDYARAEEVLRSDLQNHPKSFAAAEVRYWAGVAAYKKTNDAKNLAAAAQELQKLYPESEWTRKASVWSH
jgi:tetratricopeptide (TPR) repeat protein